MEIKNYFATDSRGDIMPEALCYLYQFGTTVLATGLRDISGNPLPNPFESQANGLIQFQAPNNTYDLRVVKGSRDYTLRGVQCADLVTVLNETAAFLGPHATAPTTREDGTPLQLGDRYFNTVDDLEYLYKSTGWEPNNLDGQLIGSDVGSEYVGFKLNYIGAVVQNASKKMGQTLSSRDFGEIADGTYHPLSEVFSDLASAQFHYSTVAITSLSDSIDWAAVQAADIAAASTGRSVYFNAGHRVFSKPLIKKASWVCDCPELAWGQNGKGVIFSGYGLGNPQRWTDINGSDPATFTPLIVVARGSTSISDCTIQCPPDRWSAGLYIPAMKRVRIHNVDIRGQWKEAGLYIDGTASSINTVLKDLHPDVEYDSGTNELSVYDCFFEGRYGVAAIGTTRPVDTLPWLWSYAGTSDDNFVNCRISAAGPTAELAADGGGFKWDVRRAGGNSQGVNLWGCGIRVGAKYTMNLGAVNRLNVYGTYAETIDSWTGGTAYKNITPETGSLGEWGCELRGGTRINDVPAGNSSAPNWRLNRQLSSIRNDGAIGLPNFYGATTPVNVEITSFQPGGSGALAGAVELRYDDGFGTAMYPVTMQLHQRGITPGVTKYQDLGTDTNMWRTLRTQNAYIDVAVRPNTTGVVPCGTASLEWSDIFSVNGRFSGPMRVGQFTLTTLPSAAAFPGYDIDVTNAAGGPKRCRSDGTTWKILNTTTTVS